MREKMTAINNFGMALRGRGFARLSFDVCPHVTNYLKETTHKESEIDKSEELHHNEDPGNEAIGREEIEQEQLPMEQSSSRIRGVT